MEAKKQFIQYAFFAFFVSLLTVVVSNHQVGALGSTYFDNGDVSRHAGSSGSPSVEVAVGQTTYVQKTAARLKVYFSSNSGNVRFDRYKYCPSGTDEGPASAKNTVFEVRAGGSGQVRVNGSGAWASSKNVTGGYTTGGGCNDSVTFNLRNLPRDNSGKFVASINVDNASNGYMNFFKIASPTSGALIAHAKGSNGWDVTVDQIGSSPKWADYKVKFGSDCSVTKADKYAIRLYDLDGPGGSGAQVGKITLKMRARDMAGGSWSYINLSNNKNSGYAKSINPIQKSNDDQLVWFTARPNYQYEFELNNIYYNNTIQYGVPFDGIYYQTGCEDWSVGAQSFVRRAGQSKWGSAGRTVTAARGETVYFRHDAIGSGPGIADTKGIRQRNWDGNKNIVAYNNSGSWVNINNLKLGERRTALNNIAFTIPNNATKAPNGTTYCQRFYATPRVSNNSVKSGSTTSTAACARVAGSPPTPYELDAYISNVPSTYSYYPNLAVTGSVGTVSGTVSGNHPWQIYAVRYSENPSRNIDGQSADQDACNQVPSDDRISGCELVYSANYPATPSASPTYSGGGPDDAGTYLCFFTRVQNPTEAADDDAEWEYSDVMQCSIAGTNPKIQVWGGDVKATGEIQTSFVDIQTRRFGSWGEYGVFAGSGSNYAMGSGNGLRSTPNNRGQDEWSSLTFANNGQYGRFGGDLTAAQISSSGVTQIQGDHTINDIADILGAQKRAIIAVNGTLTISGDLSYDDVAPSYASIDRIPRVVLIASNIRIDDNVSRIDPWLVAQQGSISTCAEKEFVSLQVAQLDSGQCSTRIVFNGPVISPRVFMYRTYDNVNGTPAAETFNLRADNILSSYTGDGVSDPVAITTSVNEVSPRF